MMLFTNLRTYRNETQQLVLYPETRIWSTIKKKVRVMRKLQKRISTIINTLPPFPDCTRTLCVLNLVIYLLVFRNPLLMQVVNLKKCQTFSVFWISLYFFFFLSFLCLFYRQFVYPSFLSIYLFRFSVWMCKCPLSACDASRKFPMATHQISVKYYVR